MRGTYPPPLPVLGPVSLVCNGLNHPSFVPVSDRLTFQYDQQPYIPPIQLSPVAPLPILTIK